MAHAHAKGTRPLFPLPPRPGYEARTAHVGALTGGGSVDGLDSILFFRVKPPGEEVFPALRSNFAMKELSPTHMYKNVIIGLKIAFHFFHSFGTVTDYILATTTDNINATIIVATVVYDMYVVS